MPTDLEITKSLEFSELKNVASAGSPCITLYLPLEPAPNTAQIEGRRLKSAIRKAQHDLEEMGVAEALARELASSLRTLESESGSWGGSGGTLVVLRSPDVFRAFEIPERMDEAVRVGHSFHVLPLFEWLQTSNEVFYILALSQKHVRLLRCTAAACEEVALPAGTPGSMDEWLNTHLPVSAPNRGAGEPTGSFTSATDRDNKDEHLANFFRVINKSVVEKLREERHPLIVCAVEHQRAMYSSVNSYPHLAQHGVAGSPESLKGPEMHARALEVAREYFKGPAKKALALWDSVAGGERALKNFPDIVKAAFEGRIAHLFAADDAAAMGVFDRDRMQMAVNGQHEDLVNAAALQTIGFGGDVFLVKQDEVPGGGQMAAITRF